MIGLRRAVPKSLRDRSEAGFTLIELIVVMAIVAMRIVLVGG